jgi:PHP family Zn ribbon phosphoesterase
MLPKPVIQRCLDFGLDVIAITDHNAIANVRPFWEEGREKGLIVVPGMELQTQEDIHLVCLFDDLVTLEAFEGSLRPFMTDKKNDPRFFGSQWRLSRQGEKTGEEERMLLAPMTISVDDAISFTHRLGGLCIAAHADRPAFSVTASLGLVPDYLPFDGVELTRHLPRDEKLLGDLRRLGYRYITACDAHDLEQIGQIHCAAYLDHWSLAELALAMKGREGRDILTAR